MTLSNDWQNKAKELFESKIASGLSEVKISSELSHAKTSKGDQSTIIESMAYNSPSFSLVRYADITNNSDTFILNLALFPKAGLNVALFEAEVVILRGKLFLYLLEFHPLGVDCIQQKENDAFFSDFHQKYPLLQNVEDVPDWALSIMSSHFVWSRPNTEEAIGKAFESLETFCDLVSKTMNASYEKLSADDSKIQAQKMEEYLDMYLREVPSRPFMKAMFGEEWTEKYLSEFVFPKNIILV